MKNIFSNILKFIKSTYFIHCCVVIMIIMDIVALSITTNEINKNNTAIQTTTDYIKDIYVSRLESEFVAAREQLADEIDLYIKTVAPKAVVNSLVLIDYCTEYCVDIKFVLAQGHLESHFATKGTAAKTNSIFNVGAYDGHSADQQRRNGFGYTHPDHSIEPYLKLLINDYLIDGKTEIDLLNNYVNHDNKRYASDENYETMLKSIYNNIDNIANISDTYETYIMCKIKLGR